MICSKEDGNESQPDDARGVHGEPNVLGLVEVLGNLPGLEGVDGAQDDEDHVVHQRHDDGECGYTTCGESTEIIIIVIILVYHSHDDNHHH